MAESRLGGDAIGAFALAVVAVLAAVVVGGDGMAWIASLIAFPALIFAAARSPLRYSIMTLAFFAFVLENPDEMPAFGRFQTPFFGVGAVLLTHLNNLTGIRALSFSGIDILLGSLLVIAGVRKLTGSKIDSAGRVPTPKPLVQLALLSLAGSAYVWVSGMLRGGDFRMSLWQLNRVVYLPIVFLLFQQGLRGRKDHAALAKVLLVAAIIRACLAVYVSNVVVMPPDPYTGEIMKLPYATSHHDSILFAAAFVLLISFMLERLGRRTTRIALLCLPVLAWGMLANNRRMVWVQIAISFFTLYLTTPSNPMKRRVKRILWALSPLIAVYVAIGWQSKAAPFKPVQMMRSVVDPQTDSSSLWREIENYDIIFTIRQFPILGAGYGNGYWEIIPLPAVPYDLERFCPHNSILGLWAFSGYFGYTAMTLLWAGGVYFGVRAYHASKKPADRVAALMSFAAILTYMIQCWGDMGLGSWAGVFTVAPALSVGGKLAVATGAWGKAPLKKAARPTESPPDPFAGEPVHASAAAREAS